MYMTPAQGVHVHLLHERGVLVGTVRAPEGRPLTGPGAPTLYLARPEVRQPRPEHEGSRAAS
jgi:hypothetical protein